MLHMARFSPGRDVPGPQGDMMIKFHSWVLGWVYIFQGLATVLTLGFWCPLWAFQYSIWAFFGRLDPVPDDEVGDDTLEPWYEG